MAAAVGMPIASTVMFNAANIELSSDGTAAAIRPGTARKPVSLRCAVAMRCRASFCMATSLCLCAADSMYSQGVALPGSSRSHCSALSIWQAPSPSLPQARNASA